MALIGTLSSVAIERIVNAPLKTKVSFCVKNDHYIMGSAFPRTAMPIVSGLNKYRRAAVCPDILRIRPAEIRSNRIKSSLPKGGNEVTFAGFLINS